MTQTVPAPKRVNGVTPKPRADIEIGYSEALPFTASYNKLWEALRTSDGVTPAQLHSMRSTDGQARALYRLLTLPIRSALKTSTIIPPDHVDGGEDEAKFIEQMFTAPSSVGGMKTPFPRVIAQMLLALFDGFSTFEMVYWSPDSGPLKGKWTLKKIAHRPSREVTFLLNDDNELAGLRQRGMYHGRAIDVTIPGEHVVYYAANEEERPFYGRSYFEAAYAHWERKFKLYVIAHLAAQRAAVGTRIGKLPPNATDDDRVQFREALAKLGFAQYMMIPSDHEVDSIKESGNFDFLAIINHHNSQMSKSILAAFFDKEQGGGDSGKLVDFGTQSDSLFMLMLQTIMGEIEEVINQTIIPRFIDWNFDSGKYPRFQFGSLSEEQKGAILDIFKSLSTAGQSMLSSPEFLHELEKQVAEEFGLEIDYEAVEERMEQEREAALAMEAAQPLDGFAAPGAPEAAPAPVIDASLVPDGFTLSVTGSDDLIIMNSLAADLLGEAQIRLTRGKPTSGGPKFVRTSEGAKTYGVPVGTPITRDLAERTAKHGVKGKPYGDRKTAKGANKPAAGEQPAKKTAPQNTGRTVLGGGPGAQAQSLGSVNVEGGASAVPERILTNPKEPGAQLLDFGDGTVAIRDADGRTSARQKYSIQEFIKLGWKVDSASKK